MSSKTEETKGIEALMILQVIGRPPEHLIKALEEISTKLGEEKDVNIKEKKIHKPKPMEKQKDFYTTFAEIIVEVEETLKLVELVFRYMPAHIEVISPETIVLTNNGWNDVFNGLVRRLHGYDEVARVLQTEKAILQKKLQEVLGQQQKPEEKKTTKKKSIKKKTKK